MVIARDMTVEEAHVILKNKGVSRIDYKHLSYEQQKKLAKGQNNERRS